MYLRLIAVLYFIWLPVIGVAAVVGKPFNLPPEIASLALKQKALTSHQEKPRFLPEVNFQEELLIELEQKIQNKEGIFKPRRNRDYLAEAIKHYVSKSRKLLEKVNGYMHPFFISDYQNLKYSHEQFDKYRRSIHLENYRYDGKQADVKKLLDFLSQTTNELARVLTYIQQEYFF